MKRIVHSSDRESWLAERRKGIGASDAPAILGVSPYGSPASVAAQKLGLAVEDPESELMRWGRAIEPALISGLTAELAETRALGTQVAAGPDGWLYRSDEESVPMLATPDGWIELDGQRGLIECKLAVFTADEWETSGPPDSALVQVQHQLHVADLSFAVLIVLLGGFRLRWRRIERDEAFVQDVLLPAERAFWDDLQAGRPVRADVGDPRATLAVLKKLHPLDNGQAVELHGQEWVDHYTRWREAADLAKHYEFVADQHKAALFSAIGPNTFAKLDNDVQLSLRTQERSGYSVPPTRFRTLREFKPKGR